MFNVANLVAQDAINKSYEYIKYNINRLLAKKIVMCKFDKSFGWTPASRIKMFMSLSYGNEKCSYLKKCLHLQQPVLEPRVSPAFAITHFCNLCNIRFMKPHITLNDLWPHVWIYPRITMSSPTKIHHWPFFKEA